MRLLKQAMAVLGTVVVIAVLVAVVTPKTAHAVVATMVQVVNLPSQSVPTWRTDNDGRSVVRLYYSEIMPAGTGISAGPTFAGNPMNDASTATVYTVPAGKRLVVDSESMFAFPPSGQKVFAYLSNGQSSTALPAIGQGTFYPFGQDWFQNAIQVRD
jgi:hypothetical protein